MSKKHKNKKRKIIIQGTTECGQTFRPSDWAERMSGHLSTFKNHRIYYSPLLRPSYQGGDRCLVLDPELKETNPTLYQHVIDFATNNKLRMGEKEEGDDDNEEK